MSFDFHWPRDFIVLTKNVDSEAFDDYQPHQLSIVGINAMLEEIETSIIPSNKSLKITPNDSINPF